MILKGPEFKKAMLLGLIVAAVPSFYFPNTFGFSGAARGTPVLFLLEFAYYMFAFYLFWNRFRVPRLLQAAFTAMGFRLAIGLVAAVLTSTIFSLPAGEALSASLYTYLPAVVLHILLVPVLLKPVFEFRPIRRPAPAEPTLVSSPSTGRVSAGASSETPTWSAPTEQFPDFGAAVSHIATYSTVELAILVDSDGLTVARAGRPAGDSDLWAPVINLLYQTIREELRRTPDTNVQRFDLALTDQRLVVVCVDPFYLAVLFDNATDELVNVRIAQAVEMVKRYTEHKYPKVAPSTTREVAYV